MSVMQQLGAMPTEAVVLPEPAWTVSLGMSDLSSAEQTSMVVRHLEEAAAGNVDALDDVFAADAVIHESRLDCGLTTLKARDMALHTAIDDANIAYEHPLIVTEGDLTFAFYRVTGSFSSGSDEASVSDVPVDFTGAKIWRFEEGKVMEHWTAMDTLTFMTQLTTGPSIQACRGTVEGYRFTAPVQGKQTKGIVGSFHII